MLLPIRLIKFQVACDVSPAETEQEHPLANTDNAVSETLRMTVKSDVVGAVEHCRGHDEPAAISDEATSSTAAGGNESQFITTGPKDRRGDELDMIVAAVQGVAHLVVFHSLNGPLLGMLICS